MSRKTEKLARRVVEDRIGMCSRLDSRFNDTDSVAFTDGQIDIYSSQNHSKATYVGEVQVQIKGQTRRHKNLPQKVTFRKQTRADFNGYLNKRGIIFFLVYTEAETGTGHPYFAVLNPHKLSRLLKHTTEDQNKISFDLEPLPTEADGIEGMVTYALQMQDEDPDITLTDESWEQATELTIFSPKPLNIHQPTQLRPGEQDFSVRITTPEGFKAFAQAELRIVPDAYMPSGSTLTLSSGDTVYEKPLWWRQSETHVAIQLTDTLRISLGDPSQGENGGSIKWDLNRNLDVLLGELSFVMAWIDNGGFSINGKFQHWALSSNTIDDRLRRYHQHVERIAEVFKFVGARLDLVVVDEITENQHKQLHDLHPALIDQIEITPNNIHEQGLLIQPVGPWEIQLLLFPGEKEGSFRVQHLLDPCLERQFWLTRETDEGTKGMPGTPFELIDHERYPVTLNLGLDRVVEIYSRVSKYETTNPNATNTVLNLLQAADLSPSRRKEFLEAAETLNDWIGEEYGHDHIRRINQQQIRLRRGKSLSPKERRELFEIREKARNGELEDDVEFSKLVALSCTILLGQNEDANFIFGTLMPGDQKRFQSWPIWALHTRPDEVKQLEPDAWSGTASE